MLYTPLKRSPIPIGQVNGLTFIDKLDSNSSKRSNVYLPSLSILFTKMITGVLRIRQTSINFSVCSSTPLALSITRITLSTAVKVLNVSSAKSLCPGVSKMFTCLPAYSKAITEVATEIPLCFSISMKSEVADFLILLFFTAPAV